MELQGIGQDGKPVSATIEDFAKKLKQPEETMAFSTSPTNIVYKNQIDGSVRQVDLKEVAQAAGIRNVQFHFDPAMAKAQGLLYDRDIDQGVAYNLERINTDEQKDKYLAAQGYANAYRAPNGDDYYSFENGKMYPINNKSGLDLSDVTRMAAHAGRDIGTAAAVTAAIGGSAVAALPTGGSSVLGAVGTASVVGAAGATAGEIAQRGVDKLIGNDADRFNNAVPMSEEVAAAGRTAMIGAAGGAAQPLLTLGGAQVAEKALAPAAEKFLGEWGATQAAKMRAGGLASRLPQGYMARFGSEEQAAAQDMLSQGQGLLKKGALTPEGLDQVTGEASALASGSTKLPGALSEEAASQQALRQGYQSRVIEQAKASMADREAQAAAEAEAQGALAEKVELAKERAQDLFPEHKKELETVFSDSGDLQAAQAAQNKIVASKVNSFSKNTGVKAQVEPVSGEIAGFDPTSLQAFTDRQINTVFEGAEDHLLSLRTGPTFLDVAPSDALKGKVIAQVRQSAAAAGEDGRRIAERLVAAIENHGGALRKSADDIREVVSDFHDMHMQLADGSNVRKSVREAWDRLGNAVQQYEFGASSTRDLLKTFYSGKNKVVEMKGIMADNRGLYNDKVFTNVVRGLDQLTRGTGDSQGLLTRPLLEAHNLDAVLRGEQSPFRGMLTTQARQSQDALGFIKNYEHVGKSVIPSPDKDAEQTKRLAAGILGGLAAKYEGGDFMTGAAVGYTTGRILSGKAELVAKVARGALDGSKAFGKDVAAKGVDFLSSKAPRAAVQGVATLSAEEQAVRAIKKPKRKP